MYVFVIGANVRTFFFVICSLYPVYRLVRVDIVVDFNESGVWVSFYFLAHHLYKVKFVCNFLYYVGELGMEAVDSHSVKGRIIYLGFW